MIGNGVKSIRDYTMFYHDLSNHTSRRGKRGVAIILSSKFHQFYKNAGGAPPICTPTEPGNNLSRRYMDITLKLKCEFKAKKGVFKKKKKYKEVIIKLALVYTSSDIHEQLHLQEFISDKLQKDPKNHSIIIAQDSNA